MRGRLFHNNLCGFYFCGGCWELGMSWWAVTQPKRPRVSSEGFFLLSSQIKASLGSYSSVFCQGVAGALTSSRGLQVPWPVSERCTNSDQCQEFTGALTSGKGLQVPGLMLEGCRNSAYWVFCSLFGAGRLSDNIAVLPKHSVDLTNARTTQIWNKDRALFYPMH